MENRNDIARELQNYKRYHNMSQKKIIDKLGNIENLRAELYRLEKSRNDRINKNNQSFTSAKQILSTILLNEDTQSLILDEYIINYLTLNPHLIDLYFENLKIGELKKIKTSVDKKIKNLQRNVFLSYPSYPYDQVIYVEGIGDDLRGKIVDIFERYGPLNVQKDNDKIIIRYDDVLDARDAQNDLKKIESKLKRL